MSCLPERQISACFIKSVDWVVWFRILSLSCFLKIDKLLSVKMLVAKYCSWVNCWGISLFKIQFVPWETQRYNLVGRYVLSPCHECAIAGQSSISTRKYCRLWRFCLLSVLSFLPWLIIVSVRLFVVMNGILSMFPRKSLLSQFWTRQFDPRLEDPAIDLTKISNLAVTVLTFDLKIFSWTRFPTATKTK